MPNGRIMEQYIDLCDPHTGQCTWSSLHENDLLWVHLDFGRLYNFKTSQIPLLLLTDSVFYLSCVVQLLKFTKNHVITLFYTLLRRDTYLPSHVKNLQWCNWLIHIYTVSLPSLAGKPDQPDNKHECTMEKLILLLLHVLKPIKN